MMNRLLNKGNPACHEYATDYDAEKLVTLTFIELPLDLNQVVEDIDENTVRLTRL